MREINTISFAKIKSLLGRQRLRFSRKDIAKYLLAIITHQKSLINYKTLYEQEKRQDTYENCIKNIGLIAKLMSYVFYSINHQLGVRPSEDYNVIDTTLIEEKMSKSINRKDWSNNRVTTRKTQHYCGTKGLFFLNQHGFITRADRLSINLSDHNILKEIRLYSAYLRGNMLADRGFGNKLVRKRFKDCNNDPHQPLHYPCNLISPYPKLSQEQLSPEERLLYKKRWERIPCFKR